MSAPAWEASKENAAPLQRGRNVSTLERAAAFGEGGLRPRKDDTEEKIGQFEVLVRPSEAPHVTEMKEDDPMMHWMAYIKFYQNAYPSDTHQQFLLMERCTRALVKMPQYANDDRFISVCAKYADKTKDPSQVFKYLHQQKVGGQTALFWVAWAFVAEKDNDFPFAEQIYKKGISKDAQPLNILKVRHRQFQRRMSRHWLNSSHRNDQLEDDDGQDASSTVSRSVLGGISHDRTRRNARGSTRSTIAAPSSHRTRNNSTSNQIRNDGGESFSIFVESEGENAPNSFLDQPFVENKRVIERNSDRRKENTLDAEKWNERGGLCSTAQVSTTVRSHSRSQSRGRGALPFAVFVDEECAAQHEKERQEWNANIERHRTVRDERTFRERGDEGMAERLTKDPLRYVRDHSQLESDRIAAEKCEIMNSKRTDVKGSKEKRSRIGFNKKLLKDSNGTEQSFEEYRMKVGGYRIAPASVTFNLLHEKKSDESSQMDLDDEVSMDVSLAGSQSSQDIAPPKKLQRIHSKKDSRVLFQSENSIEGSLNQTAISTASSVVNEATAVGVPTKREEETINTKFAMRELSMMFSSPAFGVDDVAKKSERQAAAANRSISEEYGTVDVSFSDVGAGLGVSILDNSILNVDEARSENAGVRNPLARCDTTPGFEKMALRDIKSHAVADGLLDCSTQGTIQTQEMSQGNPLRRDETPPDENAGFRIFEDENERAAVSNMPAFTIHEDSEEEAGSSGAPPSSVPAFRIFEDSAAARNESVEVDTKKVGGNTFRIFEEEAHLHEAETVSPSEKRTCSIKNSKFSKQASAGSGLAIFEDDSPSHCDDNTEKEKTGLETGDTATFSLFDDAVDMLGRNPKTDREGSISTIESGRASGAGDTATISLFNEVFRDISQSADTSTTGPEHSKCGTGFSIFVDEEDNTEEKNRSVYSERQSKSRESIDASIEEAVEYEPAHAHDIQMALRRLQASSTIASNSRSPLLSLLRNEGKCFHLPHIVLPREFRSKNLKGNTKVRVGKHVGTVSRELGRGAYGVVALLDLQDHEDEVNTIAVKAQSPTGCLAWEYEILRRLEGRMNHKKTGAFGFSRALSFMSLADGGLLSMTAGSKSGLNLVDLSNVYKLKLGELVPEILVLHYVSRMLRHLEQIHWHGRVLHCDIKPDNFVLSTSQCEDNVFRSVEYSDLLLVDFGRAVDLEQHTGDRMEARSVMFRGNACEDDQKCVAMREGKMWSYDIDTFGILSCAHVLLYGSHIKIRRGRDDRWCLESRLKRYWRKNLWEMVFDTLLNLDEESGAAIGSHARSLRRVRDEIDESIKPDHEKIRSLLARQVVLLPSHREELR